MQGFPSLLRSRYLGRRVTLSGEKRYVKRYATTQITAAEETRFLHFSGENVWQET